MQGWSTPRHFFALASSPWLVCLSALMGPNISRPFQSNRICPWMTCSVLRCAPTVTPSFFLTCTLCADQPPGSLADQTRLLIILTCFVPYSLLLSFLGSLRPRNPSPCLPCVALNGVEWNSSQPEIYLLKFNSEVPIVIVSLLIATDFFLQYEQSTSVISTDFIIFFSSLNLFALSINKAVPSHRVAQMFCVLLAFFSLRILPVESLLRTKYVSRIGFHSWNGDIFLPSQHTAFVCKYPEHFPACSSSKAF